jgi:hypothetical protein
MSRREAILAAIRTALTNTVGVGTRIYRSRVEPMARAESPAIIVEPVQGEGGFNVAPTEFLQRLRALCDQHGIVVLDLMLCSAWRDSDILADVLPPDDPLPDDVPRWVQE